MGYIDWVTKPEIVRCSSTKQYPIYFADVSIFTYCWTHNVHIISSFQIIEKDTLAFYRPM